MCMCALSCYLHASIVLCAGVGDLMNFSGSEHICELVKN